MDGSKSCKEYRGRGLEVKTRAGDCVSLSCEAPEYCSMVIWNFDKENGPGKVLAVGMEVQSAEDTGRLRVTEKCSLELKNLTKEDEGVYTCSDFSSIFDRPIYDLKLINPHVAASPSPPSTATLAEIYTSTSRPTTTTLEGPPSLLLHVPMLLAFSILTLVVLLRLIGWRRTRGNKMAAEERIVQGLNTASDAPPVGESLGHEAAGQCFPGPSHRMHQQYTADMDVDGAPRGPSVGSAQGRVDPGELSDAAAYENLRVPPGYVGNPPADTDVHFVSVHQLPG